MTFPDGRIMHAEIDIDGARIMLAEACADWGLRSPKELGGNGGSILLYVADADALFARALDAGASEMQPMEDQFWGDRMGTLTDPFGHTWSIATHIEDVAPEELDRRRESDVCRNGRRDLNCLRTDRSRFSGSPACDWR